MALGSGQKEPVIKGMNTLSIWPIVEARKGLTVPTVAAVFNDEYNQVAT
jgi:hypothetical protein